MNLVLVIFVQKWADLLRFCQKIRLNGLTKRFKTLFIYALFKFDFGAVAQLVRASDCRSEG